MRDDAAPAAKPKPVRIVSGRGHAKRRARSAKKSVGMARWVLLVLALVSGISGTLAARAAKEDVAERRRAEAVLGADTVLPLEDGESATVAEILDRAESEAKAQMLSQFLAAAMLFGLWIWSLRDPYPAIACALGLYLLLAAATVVLQPATLLAGISTKVVIILMLLAGFVAAKQQQDAQAREPGR